MFCVDFEIRSNISRRVHNGRAPNLGFDLVYHADDTIHFSTDSRALNEVLKLTETILLQIRTAAKLRQVCGDTNEEGWFGPC